MLRRFRTYKRTGPWISVEVFLLIIKNGLRILVNLNASRITSFVEKKRQRNNWNISFYIFTSSVVKLTLPLYLLWTDCSILIFSIIFHFNNVRIYNYVILFCRDNDFLNGISLSPFVYLNRDVWIIFHYFNVPMNYGAILDFQAFCHKTDIT